MAGDGMSPDDFPVLVKELGEFGGFPFLSALARLELALFQVHTADVILPAAETTIINPTLHIIPLEWTNILSLLTRSRGRNLERVKPGNEFILVWHEPSTGEVLTQTAEPGDLLAIKLVAEEIDGLSNGMPTLDVGLIYMPSDSFRLGLSGSNMFGSIMMDRAGFPLPAIIRAGFAADFIKDSFELASDFVSMNGYGRLCSGLELKLGPAVLRAGYVVSLAGNQLGASISAPTAGFGLNLGRMSFDYAFLPKAEFDSEVTHSASLSFAFGRDKFAPPVVRPVKKPDVVPQVVQPEAPSISDIKVNEKDRMNIAITNFVAQDPISPGEAAFVTEFFRGEIVNSKLFRVVEKQNMEQILAEQGFQQTGCTTQECVIQMGKILNVQRMVTGIFGKLMNKFFITINVVDIQTAEIVYSDKESLTDAEQIESAVNRIVARMTRSIYK